MRILIKGGVWKNTEDEILKAAVMKYGKNQWSRISSLLVRKSAKQCKARWHEWLDPSIKKTEWSRDEEEKLLHLAKLMPTQWRTIAPIVGRTAAQCLEHYERLLDQATRRGDAADASAADDPRRLRPGEIDPNPESKPARPDPVDMDEDEKEMLSEARARLANTRGKKAKRKAREKQLEESRRLAALQKRRELKAAGIELASRSRKVRGVDYNTEIPFQKVAPAGYFDTGGEDATAEAAAGLETDGFQAKLRSKLDAPSRDKAEAKARTADAEKLKRRREEALPDVIAQINKQSELQAMRKRGRLMLPPPQVTDRELDAVVKASAAGALAMDEGASAATRALTASYDEAPFGAAARTPRVASAGGGRGDAVLEEAAAQAAIIAQDTPLLGGESAPLSLLGDFSGATPRQHLQQTPNPLALSATPGGGGATPGGGTPHGGHGGGAMVSAGGFTPARSEAGFSSVGGSAYGSTPSRDAFGINEGDAMSDFGGGMPAAAAKRLAKQRREALAAQLGSLPAPSNEYKIVMPEMETEPADEGSTLPEGYEVRHSLGAPAARPHTSLQIGPARTTRCTLHAISAAALRCIVLLAAFGLATHAEAPAALRPTPHATTPFPSRFFCHPQPSQPMPRAPPRAFDSGAPRPRPDLLVPLTLSGGRAGRVREGRRGSGSLARRRARQALRRPAP